MKNNITEIVFILDKSGSMSGFEADTVGGFNSTIEKQRAIEGKCYVSTVLFDNTSEVIHDRVPLEKIEKMTVSDYRVGGCTALLDAVGDAIKHIGNIHKYARPEDVPENTIFIITTDGMENASCRYDLKEVKRMIGRQQENGWEFIFLGANIDSVSTAGSMGIRPERTANYIQSSKGMAQSYSAMSDAITSVRCARPLDDGQWKKKLDSRED